MVIVVGAAGGCAILAGVAHAAKRPPISPGDGARRADGASAVVTIQAGSPGKRPLFCVHAEAGDVSLYYALARHLAPDQPVLGLCAPPAFELGERRLERIAGLHVPAIAAAQPGGPYLIAGECTGGALAYEIAQQLRSAGQDVALLALLDAFPPGLPRLSRFMPRLAYRSVHRARIIGFHLANLARLRMRAKLAYAAAKAGRARRALSMKAAAVHRSTAGVSPQQAYREAFAAYDPRPYAGAAVVFRAAKLPLGVRAAPAMGWDRLVKELEVETVPGYYTTPISEPGVRVLADRLSAHLRAYADQA